MKALICPLDLEVDLARSHPPPLLPLLGLLRAPRALSPLLWLGLSPPRAPSAPLCCRRASSRDATAVATAAACAALSSVPHGLVPLATSAGLFSTLPPHAPALPTGVLRPTDAPLSVDAEAARLSPGPALAQLGCCCHVRAHPGTASADRG
jgi:hypothetical protein